jgi:phage/plasmid-associated DNA primase
MSHIRQEIKRNAMRKIETLPNHMVPLQNGILNLNTLEFTDHLKEFFYEKLKSFSYLPELGEEGFYKNVVLEASCGDESWVRRFKQLASYTFTGGANIMEKIVFFLGAPRSGKTLLAKLISTITKPINIALEEMSDARRVPSISRSSHVFIDEMDDVKYNDRDGAIRALKSLISDTGSISVRTMRSHDDKEFSMHKKMLCTSNKLANIMDASYAIGIRMEALHFTKSHANNQDTSFSQKSNDNEEISKGLNYIISGIHDLNEFNKDDPDHQKFISSNNQMGMDLEQMSHNDKMSDAVNKNIIFSHASSVKFADLVSHIRTKIGMSEAPFGKEQNNSLAKYGEKHNTRAIQGVLSSIGISITNGIVNGIAIKSW